ncbi:MAG: YihY/virulence factor BrkB family protein, partial [Blastocatellia bacterium]
MRRPLLSGMTFIELVRRTWRAAYEDSAFGKAAELAYFFLLALFPSLILLLSLFGSLPGLQESLLDSLAKVMPREAMGLVDTWIRDVLSDRGRNLLSIFMLVALWSASNGMMAMINALNMAYNVKESRSFWKAMLLAFGLTIASSIFVVGGHVLIMFGDWLAMWFAGWFGFTDTVAGLWRWVDYSIGILLLIIGVDLIYYLAPNVEHKWRLITPGAVFAVIASLLASTLFSTYLRVAPGYSLIYGSLGAFVVLMLWLYLLGLALFIGGEINSVIEERARREST